MPTATTGQQLFEAWSEDRATLGSDSSAGQGSNGQRGRKQPVSGNCRVYTDPANTGTGCPASSSAKPVPELWDPAPSLDTIETSLDGKAPVSFRPLIEARDAIVEHLWAKGSSDLFPLADRIAACADDWLVVETNGHLHLSPRLCRERLCPICQAARARKLRKRLRAAIHRMHRPKLLTLTLAESQPDIRTGQQAITKAFAKLRTRKWWKAACRSGLWVLEYKRRWPDGGWHVHIHAVLDCTYIPQALISETWKKITGTSYIVDIRVASPQHANYLTAYLTKNAVQLPPAERMTDHVRNLRSIRLFQGWGSVKIKDDETFDMDEWTNHGPLQSLIRWAQAGDVPAQVILDRLAASLRAPPERRVEELKPT